MVQIMTDFEQMAVAHDEHLKNVDTRLDQMDRRLEKMDDIIDSNHKIATSVEKLALTQKVMVEQQQKIQADVEDLKQEPAIEAKKKRFEIWKIVATTVLGAIIGALIALILK